jgi:hypothetical protein
MNYVWKSDAEHAKLYDNRWPQNPQRGGEPPRDRTPNRAHTHRTNYVREETPTIHMISGGIASGGDSDRKWRRYANNLSKWQALKIEKRFAGSNAPITFFGVDFEAVCFPHDDALVLALKMKPVIEGVSRRVKRVLVDTESSTNIL